MFLRSEVRPVRRADNFTAIRYGRVLLSTPLHAYTSPLLLSVLLQIANKLGFQTKKICEPIV
jgi:hypothetical protein